MTDFIIRTPRPGIGFRLVQHLLQLRRSGGLCIFRLPRKRCHQQPHDHRQRHQPAPHAPPRRRSNLRNERGMTTQHMTTRHGSEPGRTPVLMEGLSLAAPHKPCSRCSPLPRLALTCQHPVNVCFLNPVRTSPPLVQPVSSTPNPLVIGAFRHARQAPRSGMRVLRLRGTREPLSDRRAKPGCRKVF